MKEFDLEKAKEGAELCTSAGRPAHILKWDARGEYPLVGYISEPNEDYAYSWTKDGKNADEIDNDECDLMMASVEKDGWVNVLQDIDGRKDRIVDNVIFETKDLAQSKKYYQYKIIKTLRIDWEE